MPLNFQFAFLGPGHNYFARAIRVSESGIPQEGECITRSYGVPKAFTSQFEKKSFSKIFVLNIRGHDFLSHCGQLINSSGKDAYLKDSPTAISELSLLEPLKNENENNGYDGSSMIISFGPQSSSFFADVTAPKLKRYRFSKLPDGLNDAIQKNLSSEGYGNIYEVMMNPASSGGKECGWVILFGRGEKFEFGGALPPRLIEILNEAKKAKKGTFFNRKDNSIHRIYLNHQNSDEYVLLFGDGRCYACLHEDFRNELGEVVALWAKGNGLPSFQQFEFIPSCECLRDGQKAQNASYYHKRGAFHLAKGNVSLALKYLREAYDEDKRGDPSIEESFAMAIIAMRQERGAGEKLDRRIWRREIRTLSYGPWENQDEDEVFRPQYMRMLEKDYNIASLEAKLAQIQRIQRTAVEDGELNEWSYSKAVAGEAHEMGSPESRSDKTENELYELEGNALSHEMSTEQHVDARENRTEEKEVGIEANGLIKKSRFPFKLGDKLRKVLV